MRTSRLSWAVPRRLIEHFVSGSTVWTAASLVGVNMNTAALYFHRLREMIAQESEDASPLFGEIEDPLLRHAKFVQCAHRLQLQTLPHQPLQAVPQSEKPYQRHRELLEPGQEIHA